MSNSYAAAGIHGGRVVRIRAPSSQDVLSGRGGDINSHSGNVQFREWVRARKNTYTLAGSNSEKVRVATEVIDLVRGNGGRFLQKDPKSLGGGMGSWWIEMSQEKAISKTCQALREGAPQIRRAANKEAQPQQQQNAPLTPKFAETVAQRKPVVTSPESSPRTPPKCTALFPTSSALKQTGKVQFQGCGRGVVQGRQQAKRPIVVIDEHDDECARPEKRAREMDAPWDPASSSQHIIDLPLLSGPLSNQRHGRRIMRSRSLDMLERILELSDLEESKETTPPVNFSSPFENESIMEEPPRDRAYLADCQDADTMLSTCSPNGLDYYPGEQWLMT